MIKFIHSSVSIPRLITPCPIIDATVEIRFETDILSDAIFGVIYQTVVTDFPTVQRLPVTQIPEQVRTTDPAFIYQPHYRFEHGNLMCQVGPKIVSLTCTGAYIGWGEFLPLIANLFKRINDLGFIKKVHRLGLRYINFFEHDIFDNINLQLTLHDEPFQGKNTLIRTEIQNASLMSILNIASNVQITSQSEATVRNGSVLDIDVTRQIEGENFFEDISAILNASHDEEKKIFFTLLKSDFLISLNPEY